jgi:hypothetical protein
MLGQEAGSHVGMGIRRLEEVKQRVFVEATESAVGTLPLLLDEEQQELLDGHFQEMEMLSLTLRQRHFQNAVPAIRLRLHDRDRSLATVLLQLEGLVDLDLDAVQTKLVVAVIVLFTELPRLLLELICSEPTAVTGLERYSFLVERKRWILEAAGATRPTGLADSRPFHLGCFSLLSLIPPGRFLTPVAARGEYVKPPICMRRFQLVHFGWANLFVGQRCELRLRESLSSFIARTLMWQLSENKFKVPHRNESPPASLVTLTMAREGSYCEADEVGK